MPKTMTMKLPTCSAGWKSNALRIANSWLAPHRHYVYHYLIGCEYYWITVSVVMECDWQAV